VEANMRGYRTHEFGDSLFILAAHSVQPRNIGPAVTQMPVFGD